MSQNDITSWVCSINVNMASSPVAISVCPDKTDAPSMQIVGYWNILCTINMFFYLRYVVYDQTLYRAFSYIYQSYNSSIVTDGYQFFGISGLIKVSPTNITTNIIIIAYVIIFRTESIVML